MFDKLHRYLTGNTLIEQFSKYVIVGGLAFMVDYGMLYALTEFAHLHYLLSATISFIIGLMVNYMLSIYWVFSERSISRRSLEFIIFAVIGIVGLALNNIVMYLFTDVADINYLISKLISAFIVLIWNFGARKLILFNKPEK